MYMANIYYHITCTYIKEKWTTGYPGNDGYKRKDMDFFVPLYPSLPGLPCLLKANAINDEKLTKYYNMIHNL